MKNILILSGHYRPDSLFVQSLRSKGCRVITESDNEAMFTLLADGLPVDLVIADHQTSEVDDSSLLQYIRHVAPRIPVIVLSPSYSIEMYLKALSLGAFEYLQKPVADHVLNRVVMQAMGASGTKKETTA